MTARSDTPAAVNAQRDKSHRGSKVAPVSPPRPHRLTVEDVMTGDVLTVSPSATFHQMIGVMHRRGISALPVVSTSGDLLGIVSEADLLLKETPPPKRRSWVPEGERSATRRRKAEGVTAADVMSAPALSVGARASLAAAARLLQKHQVKRLLVLDSNDQLAGIVSRRDLLAGFNRSDAEIRSDVIDGVIRRWLMTDPTEVRVEVDGGVVRLEGSVDRRSDAEILVHLVRGLDGVVEVESAVDYRWDDRDVSLSRELHTD